MKYHLIYQITNKINGKIYIGKHSTDNEDDAYMSSSPVLKKAFNKYGKENFVKEVLYQCRSESEAYELESQIVDLEFISRKDTYNAITGGKGAGVAHGNPMYGRTWSEEERLEISNRNKGKNLGNKGASGRIGPKHPMYGRIGAKNPMYGIKRGPTGRKITEEHKEAIREGIRNKVLTEDTRLLMRINNSGEGNPMYGVSPSTETLLRKSETFNKSNPIQTPENQQRMKDMRGSGMGWSKMARELNSLGVRKKNGNELEPASVLSAWKVMERQDEWRRELGWK